MSDIGPAGSSATLDVDEALDEVRRLTTEIEKEREDVAEKTRRRDQLLKSLAGRVRPVALANACNVTRQRMSAILAEIQKGERAPG